MLNYLGKIVKSKIWKIIYVMLVAYIFFTSVISELIFKYSNATILYIIEYHDEICLFLFWSLIFDTILELIYNYLKNNNKREMLKSVLFYAVLFLVYFGCDRKLYMVYVLAIYESKLVGFNNLIKVYFYSKTIGIIVWLFMYCFGLLVETESIRNGLFLGTSHYNNAAYILNYWLVSGWYLYGSRYKKLFISLFIGMLVFDFLILKSRTSFIMMAMFMIMEIAYDRFSFDNKLKEIIKYVFVAYPILMLIIGFIIGQIIMYIYRTYGVIVDYGLGARFSEIIEGYLFMGISLFPGNYSEYPFLIFDNTYANLIYKRGLIVTAVFFIFAFLNNREIINNKNNKLIILSIFIYTYAQMEYVLKGELILVILAYLFSNENKKRHDL